MNGSNSLKTERSSKWFLRIKLLGQFISSYFFYLFLKNKKDFVKISKERNQLLTQTNAQFDKTDPAIIYAYENNLLGSSHHGLLYELAFDNIKLNGVIASCYKGTTTDIYWGDFIVTDKTEKSPKEIIARAIQAALENAKKQSRFCAFVDVSNETASTIEQHHSPLIKSYLGEEWVTDIQNFNLDGKKGRAFRKALVLANRYHFRIEESTEDNHFDVYNDLVKRFSKQKHLRFPRIGASVITKSFIDPKIKRRIWNLVDDKNNLIGAVIFCKLGKDFYFVEEGVSYKHYHFLFDWCLPQIILMLKEEGAKCLSWGRIAHLYSDEEIQNSPEAWLIHQFLKLSGIQKFITHTMQFKKDFVPIIKIPRWTFYSDFRAEVLLDIADVIGVKKI